MIDTLTIAYEEGKHGDISLLMVFRKTGDGGMKIVKIFKEEEADYFYKKLSTIKERGE